MKKQRSLISKAHLLAFVSVLLLAACTSRFPVDKPYWTDEDYRAVWLELYSMSKDEELPRFSNPETNEVIRKIITPQNYEVVLEDSELGLNYRNEVSQKFFDHIRSIIDLYGQMDVQDKFVYAEELAELRNFFLGFQIVYFKIGNENIANQSDDRQTIKRNEQTIINNFNSYLEDLRREKTYGNHAAILGKGVSTHFSKLIMTFPTADYSGMLAKAKAIREKVQTPEIQQALSELITKIESLQSQPTATTTP
ncbi:MAG: hypothetical protein EBR30_24875 [Cytophagia bacterium]|nr:hypothetical protein [Cytophagia bacterium]